MSFENAPLEHIAFIMDGNGRWAKKRLLSRSFGHREGVKTLERVVDYCAEIGIKYVTVYALSTENLPYELLERVAAVEFVFEHAERRCARREYHNRPCFV